MQLVTPFCSARQRRTIYGNLYNNNKPEAKGIGKLLLKRYLGEALACLSMMNDVVSFVCVNKLEFQQKRRLEDQLCKYQLHWSDQESIIL